MSIIRSVARIGRWIQNTQHQQQHFSIYPSQIENITPKALKMSKKIVVLSTLLFSAALIGLFVDQANAYCCKVDDWPLGHPPHCNIIGCNCDCLQCVNALDKTCCLAEKGGLSCPSSRKRHALEQPKQEAKAVFQQADMDGDGALTMEEAVHYLISKWNMTESELIGPNSRHWFSEMDLDRNEKLEPNEIDAALTL